MTHAASQEGIIINNMTAGCRTPKLFPSLCDDSRTAAPEGNRQVHGVEPQPELSARAEEEISEQTHYPYIHLLQCFRISLAGISEQLLQEPRQSLGWVLDAALPLFPLYTMLSQQAQGTAKLHTLSRSREVRASLGRGHFPKHSSGSPNSQGL